MNRLEQIVEASKANIKKREDEIMHVYDHYAGFIEGAEWADNTMIEKACEWLREHKDYVATEDNGISGWIPECFIEEFKKAMKGGEK